MALTYTARRSLPAPDNSDPVNQGAARIRDLVAALDNGGPFRSAAGIATFSSPALASGSYYQVTVTFPASRFSVPPILNLTLYGNHPWVVANVLAVYTSYAYIALSNPSSHNAASGAHSIAWLATQATSSAAAD